MKRTIITLSASLFLFLLVNTQYYWEQLIDGWIIPLFGAMIISFFTLALTTLWQAYLSWKEHFRNKYRIITIMLSAILLIAVYIKPSGIINYEDMAVESVVIATRESNANCTTTLRLKANNKFKIKSVCFGIEETTGDYTVSGDTITFKNLKEALNDFDFAVLKKDTSGNNAKNELLEMYKKGKFSYHMYCVKKTYS